MTENKVGGAGGSGSSESRSSVTNCLWVPLMVVGWCFPIYFSSSLFRPHVYSLPTSRDFTFHPIQSILEQSMWRWKDWTLNSAQEDSILPFLPHPIKLIFLVLILHTGVSYCCCYCLIIRKVDRNFGEGLVEGCEEDSGVCVSRPFSRKG